MRTSRPLGVFRAALFTACLLLVAPRPAQAASVDPRWGALAEVAERDFHVEGPLGTHALMAFRWEVPGERMSLLRKLGFPSTTIFTLDRSTGRISVGYAGDDDRASFQADAAGALRSVDSPNSEPYFMRLEDGKYRLGFQMILIETTPDTAAGRKAAKLIAEGKLRPADPALRMSIAAPAPAQTGESAIAHQAAPVPEGRPYQPGWAGILARDGSAPEVQLPGLQGAYVLSLDPDGPARAAGVIAGDIVVSLDGKPIPNTASLVQGLGDTRAGQQVTLEVLRGNVPTTLQLTVSEEPELRPLRNADRPKPPGWFSASKDPIRVGEQIVGLLESTDPRGSRWVHRTDEYVVEGAAKGRYLTLVFEPGRPSASLAIDQDCAGAIPKWVKRVTENGDTLSIDFKTGADCAIIFISGKPGDEPYRIQLREQTPVEVARFEQSERDRQLAEQRGRQEEANQPSMFGAIVSGLAMGMSGYDGPLMNADGSQLNTLDVLNAANAELARRNAEGQARLEVSIAYAQRQGQRQGRADIPSAVTPVKRMSNPIASTGVSVPGGESGSARPGYYACNSYNVTTKVLYFSPIIVRPYDEHWERRLESSFASHTARFFPGRYDGGGASCWARTTQSDAESSVADSKDSTRLQGQSWRNVTDWAPPQ